MDSLSRTHSNETSPIDFDVQGLKHYILEDGYDVDDLDLEIKKFSSGQSNPTYLLTSSSSPPPLKYGIEVKDGIVIS